MVMVRLIQLSMFGLAVWTAFEGKETISVIWLAGSFVAAAIVEARK